MVNRKFRYHVIAFLQKLLFLFEEEKSHALALNFLRIAHRLKLSKHFFYFPKQPTFCMGMMFPNRYGIAAGLDKNGDFIESLSSLGFGYIEIGTITLKPQSGNAKPRLFRFSKDKTILNRMGFNNKGSDYLIQKLKKTKYKGILGINIGKNRDTPNTHAAEEYKTLFKLLAPFASYITINISSPNTPSLRELQREEFLDKIILGLKLEQKDLLKEKNKYVPIVLKVSPDLDAAQLNQFAESCLRHKVDGIIATNTMLGSKTYKNKIETGGVSGLALKNKSTEVIKKLKELVQENIPIIASGGVMSMADANEKISAGATLVQIYSGLVFGLDSSPAVVSIANVSRG